MTPTTIRLASRWPTSLLGHGGRHRTGRAPRCRAAAKVVLTLLLVPTAVTGAGCSGALSEETLPCERSAQGARGSAAGKSGNAVPAGAESHTCDDVPTEYGTDAPCLHGGSRNNSVNDQACDCDGTGYFGQRCEISHFEWVGPPDSRGYAISANGKVVVGKLGGVPARWTAETGFQKLQALSEPLDEGAARAVNADGTVVGGYASLPIGEGAFRWTADTGVVSLELSPDSDVRSVSADGNSMAGTTRPGGGTTAAHAFRWTPSAGTEDLGDVGSGRVSGMSADGTVIVGVGSGTQSFRWTRDQGFFWLPDANGNATAVSGDGKTIVGIDNEPGGLGFFVYTEKDGYVHVDTGDLYAQPTTVNDDGSVIAGHSPELEWIWDRSNGLRMLPDVLHALGADPGNPIGRDPGYLYGAVYSVSADGKVFTGEAIDADNQLRAWIARL
jgi:uncharacterized membrane protein